MIRSCKQVGTLIGSGHFSKCYVDNDKPGHVLIRSRDNIKECMSLGWFPDSELFPKVTFFESDDKDERFNWYSMKRYEQYDGRKVNQWNRQLFCTLKGVFEHFRFKPAVHVNDYIETFNDLGLQPLADAAQACSNYGSDVRFEISKRNVAIHEGKLILLDCFFISSQIERKAPSAS